MPSRTLVILDARSVQFYDKWAWQFTAFLSRHYGRSGGGGCDDQCIALDVHNGDAGLPTIRGGVSRIDQPLSWTRYVEFVTRAREACRKPCDDDDDGGGGSEKGVAEWKRRTKKMLHDALVRYDWECDADDDEEDDDLGGISKKSVVVFTAIPQNVNQRDAFREDGIRGKLLEMNIRLVFFDLSESKVESQKRVSGRSKAVVCDALFPLLRDGCGSVANLMPKPGGDWPFPDDVSADLDDPEADAAVADAEDFIVDTEFQLELLYKQADFADEERDTVNVEILVLLPGSKEVFPVAGKFEPAGCSSSNYPGTAFVKLGDYAVLDSRHDFLKYVNCEKSWRFSISRSAEMVVRDGGAARIVVVGKTCLWLFSFQSGTEDTEEVLTGLALPVRRESVPIVLRRMFAPLWERIPEIETLLPAPSVAPQPTAAAAVSVSGDGVGNRMDKFMASCLEHLTQKDETKQKQPDRRVEKLFEKKFRRGEQRPRSSNASRVGRRNDHILQAAEKNVQRCMQRVLERKKLRRSGKSQASNATSGVGTQSERMDRPLPELMEKLHKAKANVVRKDSSNYDLYVTCRKIVRYILKVMEKQCMELDTIWDSSLGAVRRHFFLDVRAIGEIREDSCSQKELAALKVQELKLQTLLRLEAMSSLVKKDDVREMDDLGTDVRNLLSRLTMSAEGSAQLRPFFAEILVAKYCRHQGKLLVDLCGDFNLPVPANLAPFLSPSSTDDDFSNSASQSDNASEASRDSGAGPEQSAATFNNPAPAGAAGAVGRGGRGARLPPHRSICLPKSRKLNKNDDSSLPSAFGILRGRDAKRSTLAAAEEEVKAVKPKDGKKESGGGGVRRNLFGTGQAEPDPIFLLASRNKRRYMDNLSSSPRTPPSKRLKKRASPSPHNAFSVGLKSRLNSTPGGLCEESIPETPESAVDPDENVVERTPGVSLRAARQLRFRNGTPTPTRTIRVPVGPRTPESPSLFDEDNDAKPSEVVGATPTTPRELRARPVVVSPAVDVSVRNKSSPVISNFWEAVGGRPSPAASSSTPAKVDVPAASSSSLFASPRPSDPDSVAMPPPTWTPGRGRSASAKKRLVSPSSAARTPPSTPPASVAEEELEAAVPGRVTLSPVNADLLNDQTNFPSPATPRSPPSASASRRTPRSATPVYDSGRKTRSGSSGSISAVKRLLCGES